MKLFKNQYGEFRSGWSLFLSLLPMFLVQFAVGIAVSLIATVALLPDTVLTDEYAFMEKILELSSAPLTSYVMYALMIGSLFLVYKLIYNRPLKQLGFYAANWPIHLVLGGLFGIGAFALAVAVLLVSGTAEVAAVNASGPAQLSFWNGVLLFICVGFFEEILSRGFMMTALKTTRNRWVIILVPALLFGLLHIANSNVTFFSLVNIALVGVLFAYLFIKTGRLWAPIGFHITWNFVQGYIFGIPVSGSAVPESAVLLIHFTGPDWLTGGAFGVEGGAACTLVILLGLAFTRYCVKPPARPEEFWRMDGDLPLTRGTKQSAPEIE